MEKLLEDSLLYDFYSEMLTDHQRQVYQDFVMGDLSLGEIAQGRGISRQGVQGLLTKKNFSFQDAQKILSLMNYSLEINFRKDD